MLPNSPQQATLGYAFARLSGKSRCTDQNVELTHD